MFERVVEFIESLSSGGNDLDRNDKNVSIAALLYRMVTIDGVVLDVEREKLREVLHDKFDITFEDLERLIAQAKTEHAGTAGLFPFTSVIMRKCSQEEREQIATAMWQLALCDEEFHEFEGSLLERACELMEVTVERPV